MDYLAELSTFLLGLNSDSSHHLLDQWVDELLSATPSTISLDEGVSLDLEATERRGQLEWPQEVVGFLELGSAGDDLVDEVLNAVDSVLAEFTSDDTIIGEWDSASVDFTVTPLVDKLGNIFPGWVSEGDKWLNDSNHVPCGLIKLDKHTVVQLPQSEKLQDLLWLWGKLIDTKGKECLIMTHQN